MDKSGGMPTPYIQAAGGLVWRQTKAGKELLLIHRKRYGDWTLPKGKRKGSESLKETAGREVKEETGYRTRIKGFAGATAYNVQGAPKVVLYWHMETIGEVSTDLDTEVEEVVWLPVLEALQKLQHPLEKALIDAWLTHDEEIKT
jgi:8-oxo-dGTP pyrophosphatase MutT (NUDIX family)